MSENARVAHDLVFQGPDRSHGKREGVVGEHARQRDIALEARERCRDEPAQARALQVFVERQGGHGGAEEERHSEHRHDQPRRDTQGPGDGVIAPAAPVEAHGDEEAGDGEEAVHRMLAKGEARGDSQRLVRDDARRHAEGMGDDDGERESEPDRGEVVPVPCQG